MWNIVGGNIKKFIVGLFTGLAITVFASVTPGMKITTGLFNKILDIQVPITSDWTPIDTEPMFISAATTNPTIGTAESNFVSWRRDGSMLEAKYDLIITSLAGSHEGSGEYFFNLPYKDFSNQALGRMEIDDTKIKMYSELSSRAPHVGNGIVSANAFIQKTNWSSDVSALAYNKDSIILMSQHSLTNQYDFISSEVYAIAKGGIYWTRYSFTIRVPIKGWKNTQSIREIIEATGFSF